MSLKTLLQHKMTIQTAESASNASDGTLDRESAWTNTSFVNIACNIQEKTSATVDARFNKLDTYDDNKIYHQNLDLYNYQPDSQNNQTMLRVLVWRTDPTLAISFPVSESNKKHIDIYEFLGHIEQVKSRRRLARRLFHLCVEKSHKWIYS